MDLVDASRASVDSVTDFLKENDPTWPRSATLGKIEAALGWAPGSIEDMARDDGEAAMPAGVTVDLILDPALWESMTEMQRVEARAAAQVAILSKLREMGLA